MNATDIAAKFGDARRQSRAGASEIAAEAKKSPPAHPFNAVIDMIVRSASSPPRQGTRRPPFDTRRKGHRRETPHRRIGLTNTRDPHAVGRPRARLIPDDGDRRRQE